VDSGRSYASPSPRQRPHVLGILSLPGDHCPAHNLKRLKVVGILMHSQTQDAPPLGPSASRVTGSAVLPAYLDTRDAAAYIGYEKATLDWWRSKNTGPAYSKLGYGVRYAIADLDAWMLAARVVTSDAINPAETGVG
jgi:predicted DNA-binding transcriptional regulator AlpA